MGVEPGVGMVQRRRHAERAGAPCAEVQRGDAGEIGADLACVGDAIGEIGRLR